MVAQVAAKAAGDGLGDFDRRESDARHPERTLGKRRNGDATRLAAVKKGLDLPVQPQAVGEASPAGALARAEDRTDERENARRLHKQPIPLSRQHLIIELGELGVQVIAHKHDAQLRRVLIRDLNPEGAQGAFQLSRARDPEGPDPYANVLQILVGDFRPQTEGAPVGRRHIVGLADGRHEAAVDQPLKGFVDLLRRKLAPQALRDDRPGLAPRYGRSERAVQFAVEEKLSVLGVETHDVRRQEVYGEMSGEPQNLIAFTLDQRADLFTSHHPAAPVLESNSAVGRDWPDGKPAHADADRSAVATRWERRNPQHTAGRSSRRPAPLFNLPRLDVTVSRRSPGSRDTHGSPCIPGILCSRSPGPHHATCSPFT